MSTAIMAAKRYASFFLISLDENIWPFKTFCGLADVVERN